MKKILLIIVTITAIAVTANNTLKDENARMKTEIAKYEAQNAEVEKKTLKGTGTL